MEDRTLDSWKEIAAYLGRHVTTVRRWERKEGLPVHRHIHDTLGSVYAYASELDAWRASRCAQPAGQGAAGLAGGPKSTTLSRWPTAPERRRMALVAALACGAAAIFAVLVPPGRPDSPAHRRVEPAARQEYVVGRYHLWRDSESHLERAIAHFERAIAIDPGYAEAQASLAQAWWKRGLWSRRLEETKSPARIAALAALRTDDSLPDAYVVLSDLERLYGGNLNRAERLVVGALALDPDNVDAHYTYGLLLMTQGRFDEAIAHMHIAIEQDPVAPAIHSDLGRVLYRARRYDEAVVHLNRALELEPSMGWLVHQRLADVYEQTGQYDRAEGALRRAVSDGYSMPALRRARVLARRGDVAAARRLLSAVGPDSQPLSEVAAVHVALRDYDRAFATLFESLDRAEPGPNFVAVDPIFDDLHADPRWSALMRRVNERSAARIISKPTCLPGQSGRGSEVPLTWEGPSLCR